MFNTKTVNYILQEINFVAKTYNFRVHTCIYSSFYLYKGLYTKNQNVFIFVKKRVYLFCYRTLCTRYRSPSMALLWKISVVLQSLLEQTGPHDQPEGQCCLPLAQAPDITQFLSQDQHQISLSIIMLSKHSIKL